MQSSPITGHFGLLAMQPLSPETPTDLSNHSNSTALNSSALPLPLSDAIISTSTPSKTPSARFPALQHVPNPPDLAAWRQRLFDVTGTIRLTAAQFATYFPHVDNIYSHRSTQRYKRKPFVSHYWDCRLKGRPPGTPKSDDPGKRKRKRTARERDLCDVKIKITEYFPGAFMTAAAAAAVATAESGAPADMGIDGGDNPADDELSGHMLTDLDMGAQQQQQQQQALNSGTTASASAASHSAMDNAHVDSAMGPPSGGLLMDWTGLPGERYYTIQRVNGNGGNGKSDGVPGAHKHTLEESDRVKKNSVLRREADLEKERRKVMVSLGWGLNSFLLPFCFSLFAFGVAFAFAFSFAIAPAFATPWENRRGRISERSCYLKLFEGLYMRDSSEDYSKDHSEDAKFLLENFYGRISSKARLCSESSARRLSLSFFYPKGPTTRLLSKRSLISGDPFLIWFPSLILWAPLILDFSCCISHSTDTLWK